MNFIESITARIRGFRRFGNPVLIPKRARIGKGVFVGPNVILDSTGEGCLIEIGDDSVLTSGVVILTHDASSNRRKRVTYVAPVSIGARTFIGVNAVILPGVKVGNDVIIGAGSVVNKDVDDGQIVAGVPARTIGSSRDIDELRYADMMKIGGFDYYELEAKSPMKTEDVERLQKAIKENGRAYIINGP